LNGSGSVLCWGGLYPPYLISGSAVPRAEAEGFTFGVIARGESHVCGIRTDDGLVYCWGQNYLGQLGDGTATTREVPAPVMPASKW
jgi:hypothetical protein